MPYLERRRRSRLNGPASNWFKRQPLLWVPWLQAANRLRRLGPLPVLGAAAAAIAIALLIIWTAGGRSADPAKQILAVLLSHGHLLIIFAALHSALVITKRRNSLRQQLKHSWISALPVTRARLPFGVFVQASWAALWQAGIVFLAAAALVLLAGASAGQRLALLLMLAAGYVGGTIIGFVMPAARQTPALIGSRYAPRARAAEAAPSLRALGRWAIAQAFASLNPRIAARAIVPVIVSVPIGTSLAAGLAALGGWIALVYAASLLNATMRVAREAADWLESTPVLFRPFVQAVAVRPLLHQLGAALITAAALSFLGASWPAAVYFAARMWSLAALLSIIAIAAAHRHRGYRVRIAATVIVLAAAESLKHGAWLPVAGILAACQLAAASRPLGKGFKT